MYAGYATRPGVLRYLGVVLAFLLSLLCKPMLMTLPFVLLLLDYWPLRRLSFVPAPPEGAEEAARKPVPLIRLLLEKVPLFVLTGMIMVITLRARWETYAGVSYAELPLFDRLANAAAAYGWYLVHTVWPSGLGAIYPHPGRAWSAPAALAGAAAVLVITLGCCWQAGRRPWLLMGWLWFVGTLVPVLGFAQNGEQAWADRFTYWPHIGLLVALVWGVAEGVAYLRVPAAVTGTAVALVLGCLAALTAVQVVYWHDTVSLWSHTLAVTQDNYPAHWYLGQYHQQRGQLEPARTHFAEAVRLRPDSENYRFVLSTVLHSLGREEEAETQLLALLRIAPDSFPAQSQLGEIRMRRETLSTGASTVGLMGSALGPGPLPAASALVARQAVTVR
jgi:tetratricopeptide (TPR) repeat protein